MSEEEFREKNESFDDIPESYQEYLETIYRLSLKSEVDTDKSVSNIEIAHYMDIKPSSVTNMLRKLTEKSLIKWKPRSKQITLTESGKKIAKKVVYNHILMEFFLRNMLGINDKKLIHKYACELEHHMLEPIFNAFQKILGKSAVKKIEENIEKELDPEILMNDSETMLNLGLTYSVKKIIDKFSSMVVERHQDLKDIIEEEKNRFMEEIKRDK